MRQWIWRRVFAAAAGVFVLAGSAAAQQPTAPAQLPAVPVAPTGVYQPITPAPAPAASAATPIAPTTGAVVVQGSGGCGSCGNGYALAGTGFKAGGNGCSTFKSNNAFIFGSCKSFFDPCGPGGGRQRCPITPIYGHGPAQPFNPCIYDSYLNH